MIPPEFKTPATTIEELQDALAIIFKAPGSRAPGIRPEYIEVPTTEEGKAIRFEQRFDLPRHISNAVSSNPTYSNSNTTAIFFVFLITSDGIYWIDSMLSVTNIPQAPAQTWQEYDTEASAARESFQRSLGEHFILLMQLNTWMFGKTMR